MDFKGKVQNKLKSRQKVCKICQKILLRNRGGGTPPQMQYVLTDFAHFLSTFELVLNFPFKIHWFS